MRQTPGWGERKIRVNHEDTKSTKDGRREGPSGQSAAPFRFFFVSFVVEIHLRIRSG